MTEAELIDLLDRLDIAQVRRLRELIEQKAREHWSCPRNTRYNHQSRGWDRRPL